MCFYNYVVQSTPGTIGEPINNCRKDFSTLFNIISSINSLWSLISPQAGTVDALLTVVEALVCPLKIRFRVTVGSFVGHC